MKEFSGDQDKGENIGELVLETLLNSSIDSITEIYFDSNSSWFWHPVTGEERSGNVNLLTELI